EKAEVVPDARILRFVFREFLEDGPGLRKLLEIQQSDGLVEPRCVEMGIKGIGFLEFREGVLLFLTFHVSHAEIIVMNRFGFRSGICACGHLKSMCARNLLSEKQNTKTKNERCAHNREALKASKPAVVSPSDTAWRQ